MFEVLRAGEWSTGVTPKLIYTLHLSNTSPSTIFFYLILTSMATGAPAIFTLVGFKYLS